MFSAKIRYFSNVLGSNYILFECSLTDTILVERFAQKFNTFLVFWGIKLDTFQYFQENFDNFRLICSKITLFSNILSKNSILFECLGSLKNYILSILRTNSPIQIFRMF